MSRSGQGAGRPPLAIIAAGSAGRRRSDGLALASGGAGAGRLGVVGHVLRSRRFYEKVAVAAIVLGALRRIGQDNRASPIARLQAWNKREIQRLERKAQRQGRAVKGSARMARSRTRRGLAGAGPRN
jgi:hypothetical protein